MRYDNKLARKSAHNAWFNWRSQFTSEDEAAIILLRIINSRIKNNSKIRQKIFTRKFVNKNTIESLYRVKDKLLLYFEQKGYLTECYPDGLTTHYECRNCKSGCVACHGKKYIDNKVLYKKIFNLNNKQYIFHSYLKPKNSELLINKLHTTKDITPFMEVDQIDLDVNKAISSLNVFYSAIPLEKKITSWRTMSSLTFDSVESIRLFTSEQKNTIAS